MSSCDRSVRTVNSQCGTCQSAIRQKHNLDAVSSIKPKKEERKRKKKCEVRVQVSACTRLSSSRQHVESHHHRQRLCRQITGCNVAAGAVAAVDGIPHSIDKMPIETLKCQSMFILFAAAQGIGRYESIRITSCNMVKGPKGGPHTPQLRDISARHFCP